MGGGGVAAEVVMVGTWRRVIVLEKIWLGGGSPRVDCIVIEYPKKSNAS